MALSKIDTTNMIEDVPQSKLDNNINFRNIIINGDMSLAQRGTSSTNVSTGYHTCDRWRISRGAGTITMSQATDAPTGSGFVKSVKFLEAGSGSSPSAGDRNFLQHRIEGQNLQYLRKGTSSAKQLTLSFHVKSTVTGTYIAELFDNDNSRQVSKAYTISSANTWEYKTITFPADTSGTLDNDNANSINLNLYFTAGTDYTSGTLNTTWNSSTNANRAVGQVNVVASASGSIQWTGIQLEAGTTASDFEFLPVDVNLKRCQRYFEKMLPENMVMLRYSGSTSFGRPGNFKVTKRATPTISREDGTTTIGAYDGDGSAGSASNSNWALNQADVEGFSLSATTPTSPDQFFMGMGGDHFFADSEL